VYHTFQLQKDPLPAHSCTAVGDRTGATVLDYSLSLLLLDGLTEPQFDACTAALEASTSIISFSASSSVRSWLSDVTQLISRISSFEVHSLIELCSGSRRHCLRHWPNHKRRQGAKSDFSLN